MNATATQIRNRILSRVDGAMKVRITRSGEVHFRKRGPHGDGQKGPVWLMYAATIREAAQRLGFD